MSEAFANLTNIQKIHHCQIFRMSESFANMTNIQTFTRVESFEWLNFFQMCKYSKYSPELIETFKRFDSGGSFEYLSYLQKIQLIKRFNFGECLEYL